MNHRIGFLFPGQGSQSVGMGHALYESNVLVRECYDEASTALGYDVGSLCFHGPAEQLNLTEYTQPCLLVTSISILRLLESANIHPSAVAGHSLGEYSAIVSANGLSFSDAVELVQKRARYMAEAVPPGQGLVAALLGLTQEAVQEICQEAEPVGLVAPANFNSPGQIVIAGDKAAVERAIEIAKAKGCKKAVKLPVSVPVHTPLMEAAADRLANDLEHAVLTDLRVLLINNVDAQPIRLVSEVRRSLIRQLAAPVLWEQSMKAMWDLGVTTFIEIGPGKVLSGLAKRIVSDAVILNVQDASSLDATVNHLASS